MRRFRNRREAGRILARRLSAYADRQDVIVLALPRGGVVVGYEVARELGAPLDVLVVRKLGVPGHEELGFGALATGGVKLLNQHLIEALRLDSELVEHVVGIETAELKRRERAFRGSLPSVDVRAKTVLLIDDGIATGATMLAAIQAVRAEGASSIIVGAPVASNEACASIRPHVDLCICLLSPEPFHGVGTWYSDFEQTSDAEVKTLLAASRGITESDAPSVESPAGASP